MAQDLCVEVDGELVLSLHPGQTRAWESRKRFVCVLAGTQGGKTSFGPHWLVRELSLCGPGDYLVVTPTFQLLEKKALPELLKLCEQQLSLGKYYTSPVRKFKFSPDGARRMFGHYNPRTPTNFFFGYAEDPESLESATCKGAWLDEAGQKKFKLGSWEAILRRLSLAMGRVLLTTTPYDLGWLKQQIFDVWNAARKAGPETLAKCPFDVVRFDSTENPNFPQEEFLRAKGSMPRWKFNLFYRAIFTRPAGLIYDSFRDTPEPHGHLVPRFNLNKAWPRYLGLDFGGVNTAGMFYAREMVKVITDLKRERWEETKRLYAYREYLKGGRTAKEHAEALLEGEPMTPVCVGGSKSEGQWRNEFRAGGLPVMPPPLKDVEVGIDRVYGCHKRNEILVFDDLKGYLEQKLTYSREVDDKGEPTEAIEDKETYHYLDAERYIIQHLYPAVSAAVPQSQVRRPGGFK